MDFERMVPFAFGQTRAEKRRAVFQSRGEEIKHRFSSALLLQQSLFTTSHLESILGGTSREQLCSSPSSTTFETQLFKRT